MDGRESRLQGRVLSISFFLFITVWVTPENQLAELALRGSSVLTQDLRVPKWGESGNQPTRFKPAASGHCPESRRLPGDAAMYMRHCQQSRNEWLSYPYIVCMRFPANF